MNQPRAANPVSLAVITSLVVVAVIILIGGSIIGSYALTLHEVNVQAAHQAAIASALHLREQGSAVRTAIPVCKAFLGMARASDTPPHLAAAIEKVVSSSKCGQLLQMVQNHVPFNEIARRLGVH